MSNANRFASLTDAQVIAEFELATRWATPTAAQSYHDHWKVVAREMDRRGLTL